MVMGFLVIAVASFMSLACAFPAQTNERAAQKNEEEPHDKLLEEDAESILTGTAAAAPQAPVPLIPWIARLSGFPGTPRSVKNGGTPSRSHNYRSE